MAAADPYRVRSLHSVMHSASRADPAVLSAEEDKVVHASYVPNDPSYSSAGSWGQGYDDLYGLKKIGADLQGYKSAAHRNQGDRVMRVEIARSGGQPLAALCPSRRQHPAPGRSCHACPEAVAALANEVAGLVSALHGTGSE